jgi:hypothetical protein
MWLNDDQANKDDARAEAFPTGLREPLQKGAKAPVGDNPRFT